MIQKQIGTGFLVSVLSVGSCLIVTLRMGLPRRGLLRRGRGVGVEPNVFASVASEFVAINGANDSPLK